MGTSPPQEGVHCQPRCLLPIKPGAGSHRQRKAADDSERSAQNRHHSAKGLGIVSPQAELSLLAASQGLEERLLAMGKNQPLL